MFGEEKSVFMLKPEAIPYKQEIMSLIEREGIPIKEWRELRLTETDLRKLYPMIQGEMWYNIKKHLLDKNVLAALVEGKDVVNKLCKLCGTRANVFLCEYDSIRFLFKDITPQQRSFSKNIIHRPINKEEADEHLMLFFPPRN